VGGVSGSNVEIVRRLFDLYDEGGVEAVLEVMDESVLIEIPADMSAEPDSYRGHDGVRRYFAGFDGMIEDVRYEAKELLPVGDRVLAEAHLSGRGVSSGLEVGIDAFVVHELADGRIVRMRPYPDREAAMAALDSAD
jgi:ketosteroid isomerase-like protein